MNFIFNYIVGLIKLVILTYASTIACISSDTPLTKKKGDITPVYSFDYTFQYYILWEVRKLLFLTKRDKTGKQNC